jgi:hypothetical protein
MSNIDMSLIHTDPKYISLASDFTARITKFTSVSGVTVGIASGEDFTHAPLAWHDLKTGDIVLNAEKLPGVNELLALSSGQRYDWMSDISSEYLWMFSASAAAAAREIPGALVHEGAHSKFSGYWTSPWIAEQPAHITSALNGLEEIRVETLSLSTEPSGHTKRWRRAALRASTNRMIMPDIEELTKERNPSALLSATLLIIGRNVGGVLLDYEVASLKELVVDAISSEFLEEAEEIFSQFVVLEDIDNADRETAIDLARRWSELSQKTLPEIPVDLPGLFDILSDIVGETTDGASKNADWGSDHAPGERAPSKERSETVFNTRGGRAPSKKIRKPRSEERRAAIELAKALENFTAPTRTAVKKTSAAPPGRLRTRAAVARSADRSAGRISTAEPWQYKKKSRTEATNIVAGIMTDVSGSMGWAEQFVATMTYIVGKAVRHVNGRSAAVVFGNTTVKVTGPGDDFTDVVSFAATGSSETPNDAFAALDGELRLTTSRASYDATRMVFVISDGFFVGDGEMAASARWVEHLTRNGVHVFWIFKSDHDANDKYYGRPACPKGAVPIIVNPALSDLKKANIVASVIKKVIK